MYKINDKVVITNSKDPYYRRRGTITGRTYSDWYVLFTDKKYRWYSESEIKPYIKKISKPKDIVLYCFICKKTNPGKHIHVEKISKEEPLTWDKPKECFYGESCPCQAEQVQMGQPMYPSKQFTITVKLKITAETEELAKDKVRRYLDRQMLEGSVE